ncbi:hypothetical protein [uncultured Lutibacter sp.]|uniref:hypothetical protein n=1 Tax=uncultured Lutibacter sp. TaxID=437739 RepID=UPI002625EA85|nr:hypothetical protein [uncultured Lutibacter sp.]
MKNNLLISLLVVLVTIISLNSCNNDDGSSSSNTLLESLGGTEWKYTDGEDVKYYRFKNNLSSPFEEWWGSINGSCYDYYLSSNASSLEIIENSKDNFKVILDYGHASETYLFTMSGSSLKLNIGVNDGGNLNALSFLFDEISNGFEQRGNCPD